MRVALIAAVLVTPVIALADASGHATTGRYQLFQGTYEIIESGTGRSADQKAILKIDSVTGNTWVFVSSVGKDAGQGWLLLGEYKPSSRNVDNQPASQ